MSYLSNHELIEKARSVLQQRDLYLENSAGGVACAMQSLQGKIYLGVCIDMGSGIGFCAEHAAIAAMITAGESAIARVVAITGDKILPPCGRCREFMYQIDPYNLANTEVILSENRAVRLSELLPYLYHEVWAK